METPNADNPSISSAKQIDAICDHFEQAWIRGERLSIDKLIAESPVPIRAALSRELAALEIELRSAAGEIFSVDEYASYLPDLTVPNQTFNLATSPIESRSAPTRRIRYFGDFELLEKTASGGMGTVFRARQLSLNRIVAIKMINSGQFASKQEVARFYSEAKAAASLDHPNIVPVYEVGEFQGDHFYSMAFVEGQSLHERLKSGPIEANEAAMLMQTVAGAVQYAHENGIVHRDLKPSNILLDTLQRPRVTDFGLAKMIEDTKGITVSGEVLGTPSFMAPEQAAGTINLVSFATDIYALGAVLYTCVSGRPPFQAANHVATLKQVIENEPVPLRQLNSAIPRDLETIVHKCLDKSIQRRYHSVAEFSEDLERFLTGQPIRARPVGPLEKTIRWCRRNPAVAINFASVIAFALLAAASWTFFRLHERQVMLQQQAASAVEQLNVGSELELPQLVFHVRTHPQAIELLRLQFDTAPPGSLKRYRAALGLLPGDKAVLQEVCSAWLKADWNEWNYLRDQLSPQTESVAQWVNGFHPEAISSLSDSQLSRFVAIKSVVSNDPQALNDGLSNTDWERTTTAITGEIVRDPSQMPYAVQALSRVSAYVTPNLLARTNFKRRELVPDASIAARLLGEFYQKNHGELLRLASSSKSEWLPVLLSKARNDETFRAHMLEVLTSPIPQASWDERIVGCRKRAIAATMLFGLRDYEAVWPLLYHHEDATVRSLIIEWIPVLNSDPSELIRKIRSLLEDRQNSMERTLKSGEIGSSPSRWLWDKDSSLLRSLLQALGNYSASVVQRSTDDAFWKAIMAKCEFDPDPGVRSTCEWLLRRSGKLSEFENFRSQQVPAKTDSAGWIAISNGHFMTVIHGPILFEAGADALDPFRNAGESIDPVDGSRENWSEDRRHSKQIDRSFMIAMHETRLSQMHAFDPTFHKLHNKNLGPTLEHPACRVSWKAAMGYCNWLSKLEGIPEDQWCFTSLENGEMQVAPNYLQRQGYRLPTEAEWEYACRAGTTTRTYLGDSDELLLNNVWFNQNSLERVLSVPGTFKCNDLGLFDMFGNISEWCMDGFEVRNPGTRLKKLDVESPLDLDPTTDRILRGESLFSSYYQIRASEYSNFKTIYRNGNTGFRIARTILD